MKPVVCTSHSKKQGVAVVRRFFLTICFAALFVGTVSSLAWAQEPAPAAGGGVGLGAGLLGLAAALAVGLGAIGTAWAQARIGAAAAGAMAERPEIGGRLLIFLALPETMIILGFLVAFLVIPRIR